MRALPYLAISGLLAGCGGGLTPIGDNWHLGSVIGIVITVLGITWLIYRDAAKTARDNRQERRDERREERKS